MNYKHFMIALSDVMHFNLKYYLLAGVNVIILQVHRVPGLDERIKTLSLIVGLLIGIITVVKFIMDIKAKVRENKLLDLEIKRKEHELNNLTK